MNVQSFDTAEPRTAAQWFAVRRTAHSEDLERRFSTWLAASAANFEAYALCELTWELSATAAAGLTPAPAARPWHRRPLVRAAAAASVIAALGLLAFNRLTRPSVGVWNTQPGQQLSLTLEDGTHVTLNTRSRLESRMSRSRRVVRLLEGEAFFDVARDRLRSFDVETPLGSVRALGTRFDLLIDSRHLEVNMKEGRVLVRSATPGGRESLAEGGMRATVLSGSPQPQVDAADLNRIENWRAHRVEFDHVPLGEALQELSRYTAVPVRAGSPAVAQIVISAVLKTGDVDALRATLRGAFDLRVVEGPEEYVVVASAPEGLGDHEGRRAR